MRLNETLTLRAKDIDFYRYAIVVQQAKGGEDQLVTLPQTLVQPLREKVDPIPFYVGYFKGCRTRWSGHALRFQKQVRRVGETSLRH